MRTPPHFGPCTIYFKSPTVGPTISHPVCRFPYEHCFTFETGERIPTVADADYAERFSHERADYCPAGLRVDNGMALLAEDFISRDVNAFAGMNHEGPPQWSTTDSNPIDDIKAFFAEYDSPKARAARRRDYEWELARFGRLLTLAGYGRLVPPPYRSDP